MDPRPARMPWLSPYLAVRNLDRSVDFYTKAFGFKTKGMKDHDGSINHINVFHKNTVICMLHPENSVGSPARAPASMNVNASQTFYVFVDNVDKIYEKAVASGCRSIVAPEDFYWGDRMCTVVDLDGYSWSFAKVIQKPKAKKKSSTKKKVGAAKKKGTTKKKKTAAVKKSPTKKTKKKVTKRKSK